MNAHETVRRFAERISNPRKGNAVKWRGAVSYGYSPSGFTGPRIYCEENTLYSYGGHYVLAHFLGDGDGNRLFLKNGDRASQTTSRQQAEVQELCHGPTVSFSAFAVARVDLEKLTSENVLDFAQDTRVYLMRNKESGVFYRLGKWNAASGEYERADIFTPPRQGAFFPDRSQPEKNGFICGVWHIVAACLIHVNGRYLLSAVDEGSYFVSELCSPATTIEAAFDSLKPREVRKAERKGATVKRQGEWFFVGTDISLDRKIAELLNLPRVKPSIESLPRRRDVENCHRCFVIEHSRELWARGTVRHQREEPRYIYDTQTPTNGRVLSAPVHNGFTYRATREHAALKLGKEWHRVYRNTELAAWTAARTRWSRGGVD
jgi:hypothetical protein